jgi:hypothetical protein
MQPWVGNTPLLGSGILTSGSALEATRLLGINEKKELLTLSNLIAPIHGYIPTECGKKVREFSFSEVVFTL